MFPAGYPSTVGEFWDYSFETFETSTLPEGSGPATLRVWDAAGNVTQTEFELFIDGDAPTVAIVSPSLDTAVTGAFEVDLSASDPGGGPVWIDLSVGGSVVGTAAGSPATIVLYADDFPAGETVLEAVAIDEAGNVSAKAARAITIL